MNLGLLLVAALATQATPEETRLRALVNKLMIADQPAANAPVYPYPPMRIPGEPEPKIDPNHPQILAYDAVKALKAMGTKAWPFLIERFDDERQSIPMASEIPSTVGRTCFHLIAQAVNPRSPGGYFDDYDLLTDADDVRLWWGERKGGELRDLQVEAARFAWALADFDQKHLEHYAGALRKLGVKDPSEGAEPWRALTATLKTPDDPDALVPLLVASTKGNFLNRRLAQDRSGRAWSKLFWADVASFPALAKGLEDPVVATRCFRIMRGVLHPYGLDPYNDVEIIRTPAEAAAWWKTRQGRTLKELQLEAARHARAGLEKKTYATAEEKTNLLDFIDEQIQRIIDRKP